MNAPTAKRPDLRARVTTGILGGAGVAAVVLAVPPRIAFFVWLVAVIAAVGEFVRIARRFAPTAPLGVLWWAVPAASLGGYWAVLGGDAMSPEGVLILLFAIVVLASLVNLLAGTATRDVAVATGLVAFAIPYFAVPLVAVFRLHLEDRWLLVLLLLIVIAGDTFAFFVGRAFGRRPLAPQISPKKTWEGTIGGFLGSLLVAALWSQLRLGEIRPALLLIAAVTAVVAPLGDLLESAMKRGAKVKDSSRILPGHGGLFDRLDSILLAAPTFLAGLWMVGYDLVRP